MMVYELTLRLATALVVGTVIGIERQWRHKLAGLRTNVLVSVGAAAFCLIAAMSDHEASPTRIAAQVASGIGFLCGGIILRDGLQVRGINTAASLWCAAAGGAMAGSGLLLPAVAISLLILSTNLFLRQLTSKFEAFENTRLRQEIRYEVQIICEEHVLQHVRAVVRTTVRESSLVLMSTRSTMLTAVRQFQVVTELAAAERADFEIENLITRLSMEEGIISVAWQCTADPSQTSDPLPLMPVGRR
jgi:putative Mg2+ transporter-C (MgtC) family protein